MLNPSAHARNSTHRFFVYEVTGLRQSDQTEQQGYPVRNSSSVFIQVPYNRMNDEMRRITRLGGKIVGIQGAAQPE
ncbi:MAG: phycobilisome linker polypeptide [Thermosynechococcaceae cyanobacterium]